MKIAIVALLLSATAFAQTNNVPVTPVARMSNPYKLCSENDTIVAMPVGTIFQFGQNEIPYGQTNTWLPPETSNATYPKLPFLVTYTAWPTNPTPETKEIDIQQTSVAQVFQVKFYGKTVVTTVTIPALASSTPPAPTTNVCSTDNTSCTIATKSDAAFIVSTAGQVSLTLQETQTLKDAIASVDHAHEAVIAAESNLQTIKTAIAANHGAVAAGPYQIVSDFSTTIEQVPPAPLAITIAK